MSHDLQKLFADAEARADSAAAKWKHDSVDFTCNRVSEEAGELVAAATSRSKGRDVNRHERMYDEAVDSIAMIIRLLREWPDGHVEGVNPPAEQVGTFTKALEMAERVARGLCTCNENLYPCGCRGDAINRLRQAALSEGVGVDLSGYLPSGYCLLKHKDISGPLRRGTHRTQGPTHQVYLRCHAHLRRRGRVRQYPQEYQ